MTPEEKAKELFNKMDMIIYTDQDNWKSQCKQCALIAVDEILNIKPNNPFIVNGYYKEPIQYWREVKQEIEKL
jgi:hypothetical protein